MSVSVQASKADAPPYRSILTEIQETPKPKRPIPNNQPIQKEEFVGVLSSITSKSKQPKTLKYDRLNGESDNVISAPALTAENINISFLIKMFRRLWRDISPSFLRVSYAGCEFFVDLQLLL